MKITIKIFAIALLLFNAFGALYGGISLIRFPDGSDLQMPLSILEHSPFKTFLVPGIVLLLVNGIGSFITLIFLLIKNKFSLFLLATEGVLLCGWIVVQILMIRQLLSLHYIMFSTGVLMIFMAILGKRFKVI